MKDDNAVRTSLRAPFQAPTAPVPARETIMPWTVRLSRALIEEIKAIAYERRLPPSVVLEDLARKALAMPDSSGP